MNFIVPKNVTSIGDEAFEYCTNLMNIIIPSSVTSIGVGVFNGCENVVIHTNSGSFAEHYAQENDIPYVTI